MDHVAIMNPKWKLIDKIVGGQKTIESRWYKSKFTPWDKINAGDIVYFKDAGKKVRAKAVVKNVLQFELKDLKIAKYIIQTYGKNICLQDTDYSNWVDGKKYCILIFLQDAMQIEPFEINKTGFGNACAWLSVGDIDLITKNFIK